MDNEFDDAKSAGSSAGEGAVELVPDPEPEPEVEVEDEDEVEVEAKVEVGPAAKLAVEPEGKLDNEPHTTYVVPKGVDVLAICFGLATLFGLAIVTLSFVVTYAPGLVPGGGAAALQYMRVDAARLARDGGFATAVRVGGVIFDDSLWLLQKLWELGLSAT